jgi:hypothetical protein
MRYYEEWWPMLASCLFFTKSKKTLEDSKSVSIQVFGPFDGEVCGL